MVRHLGPQPLLIDVGANAGQSALCMAMLRPDARIISFEANADNVKELGFIRRILGKRYAYHHVGLSDRNGSATLTVPVIGRHPVPGESSLLREFDSDIEERIGTISEVVTQEVILKTFDSFGLQPAFVKIDVQGHKLQVLRGMEATIVACRPVLMIENNSALHDIRCYMASLGYMLCNYDQQRDLLTACDLPRGENYFAVPRDHETLISTDMPDRERQGGESLPHPHPAKDPPPVLFSTMPVPDQWT